jgi:hypothetical protein
MMKREWPAGNWKVRAQVHSSVNGAFAGEIPDCLPIS